MHACNVALWAVLFFRSSSLGNFSQTFQTTRFGQLAVFFIDLPSHSQHHCLPTIVSFLFIFVLLVLVLLCGQPLIDPETGAMNTQSIMLLHQMKTGRSLALRY